MASGKGAARPASGRHALRPPPRPARFLRPKLCRALFPFFMIAAVGFVPGRATAGATAAVPATSSAATAHASPLSHASRIITLAPHLTEMVFAAGAGRYIVGTVGSSDYPPRAKKIPRVGNGIQLSIEHIVALRPDLIIAWQASGAARVLKPIATRLRIPIIYIAPKTLRDIPADIIELGKRLGSEARATQAAALLSRRISALSARYAGRKTVSTFIEVGAAPLYTLGGDPLINDALRLCGGVNIYANAPLPAPQISAESVLAARPQAVIIPSTDPKRLAARTRYWAQLHLPAAMAGHFYGINPDELFRPGPRLIDATATLCRDLDRAR